MRAERSDRRVPRLPGAAPEDEGASRRRRAAPGGGGLRAAGIAGSRVAAPILARRGGGVLARLKAQWAAVAGSELAAASWPMSLGRDGALKLRVAPGAALDLQHRAPLVVERINLFFGHEAVARLVLVQGPLPLATARRPPSPSPLGEAEASALDARLAGIADPELRAALARLGRLVLAGAQRGE